jgi:hypothetical protein
MPGSDYFFSKNSNEPIRKGPQVKKKMKMTLASKELNLALIVDK